MTQDPAVYPEPAHFDPDRYLRMSAEEAEHTDPRDVIFGFGRRLVLSPQHNHQCTHAVTTTVYSVCPGQFFADATLWLAAANVIATMDLSFAKDTEGREIVPEAAFISGFVRWTLSWLLP